jgi:soluble lytic murein transglycosylase-like protein
MAPLKTSRPFQERFLDGFDRSQLRQEVQKVKPKRFGSLRKKYATWALGGALALGGIGIPLKGGHILRSAEANTRRQPAQPTPSSKPEEPVSNQISGDMRAAKQIADQVASGVQGAVSTVASAAAAAPAQIGAAVANAPEAVARVATEVAKAPEQVANIAESVKENFFKKEVPFGSIIYSEAKKNNLAPELVAAVAHTESKFVPTARSNRGAIGLMQLVPRTGRWLGARNLMDPSQNIMAGAKYLKYLTDQFGGNQEKAIAAYNAGEGNVRRFGGVPPFRETRDYVQKVRTFQQDLGDRLQGHVVEVQGGGAGL